MKTITTRITRLLFGKEPEKKERKLNFIDVMLYYLIGRLPKDKPVKAFIEKQRDHNKGLLLSMSITKVKFNNEPSEHKPSIYTDKQILFFKKHRL